MTPDEFEKGPLKVTVDLTSVDGTVDLVTGKPRPVGTTRRSKIG